MRICGAQGRRSWRRKWYPPMQTDEKQSVYFEPRHGQAQRKAHTLLQKENKVGARVGVKTS